MKRGDRRAERFGGLRTMRSDPTRSAVGLAKRALVVVVFMLIAGQTFANDGSGDVGVGGTVFLMKENPNIRMVSEEVFIKVPECRVETRFVFKNSGRATSVLMIFPENGYLNTATKELEPMIRPKYTHFKSFRAWVDGKPFHVTRLIQRDHPYDLPDYIYWWVKRVPFAAGQTRVVVNKYEGGLGWWGMGLPARSFGYVIGTGASWKGRIGSARIVCDVSGVRNGLLSVDPPSTSRKGDRIVWEFRNFQPEKEARISLSWLLGYANVSVNGSHVTDRDNWVGPIVPRRQGGEVWVPSRTAAGWLGAQIAKWKPGQPVSITRAGRTVALTPRSRTIRSGAARFTAPRTMDLKPMRYGGASLIVPLRLVVQALGGESAFDRSGRLDIKMPPVRPLSEFGTHVAPSLIGRYHFDGNPNDREGKSDAITLRRAEMRDEGLYLNGEYENQAKTSGYWASFRTPGLHYESFAVAVRFKPESFIHAMRFTDGTCILSGGPSYRWFSLFRSESGHLGVGLNNGEFEYEFPSSKIVRGEWTVVSCGIDVAARRVVAFQEGRPVGECELPEAFDLSVAPGQAGERDKEWAFTNRGNGTTFHGLVSDLLIYDGTPSRAGLARLLLGPRSTPPKHGQGR